MQLLISVRSPEEVAPALAGGAEIIDAKEPAHGSLGPVDQQTLRRIFESVPDDCPISIALGDFSSVDELRSALQDLAIPRRAAPSFLKFGFAGVRSPEQITLLLETAGSITRATAVSWKIVAVGYADWERAATIAPGLLRQLASAAGSAAILMDTWTKDGSGLLNWLQPDALADWVFRSREAGLLTALAGSLKLDDLSIISQAAPDIVGVRGAVCQGGREGKVSESRVRRFHQALLVGSLGEASATGSGRLGETPCSPAILSRHTIAK